MGKKSRSKQVAKLPPAGRSTPEAQRDMAHALVSEALEGTGKLAQAVAQIEAEVERQINIITRNTEILASQGRGSKAACRMGCSYCCRQQVTASVPEVLRLAQYIRDTYTPQQRAALTERFASYRAGVGPFLVVGVSHHRNPCPLLIDDACSVRPARPIVCRGWNSMDVRICEIKFHDAKSDRSVPMVGSQVKTANAFDSGLRLACAEHDLDPRTLDLAIALEIALNTPDAEARWRAGEDPFSVAAIVDATGRDAHSA